jgi:hypothetical protein
MFGLQHGRMSGFVVFIAALVVAVFVLVLAIASTR